MRARRESVEMVSNLCDYILSDQEIRRNWAVSSISESGGTF